MRYFLIVTPPVPESEREDAKILGRERFHRFVAQVGRRLGSDQRLISQVLETIVTEKPELFADTQGEAEETSEIGENREPDDDEDGEARGE